MGWRSIRLAALVVALPLLTGLAAGVSFELVRGTETAHDRIAAARSAPRAERPARAIDALWNRLAHEVALESLGD